MQRTNILRDIDEDLGAGRVYLARETLERLGWATVPPPTQREALLRDQIARADALYDVGMAGVALLPCGRRAIGAAGAMYREILRQIERDGYGSEAGRAIVSRKRKLFVAARAPMPGPPRMRRLFAALFGTLVATQLVYGKVARLRTPAGTKAIVGLLLGASTRRRGRRARRLRAGRRSSAARPRWASRPSSPASRPGGRSATTRTRASSGAASAACRSPRRLRGR